MLLHPAESVLRSAYAVLERSGSGESIREAGVLYLTNQRLVFESPERRGVVRDFVGGREVSLLLDVKLADLRNVSVRRGRWARPRLVLELSSGRPVFDVLDPAEWTTSVAQAKHGLPPPRGHGSAGSPDPGPPVVKVRCRYCGSLGNEGLNRCPSCGAPL